MTLPMSFTYETLAKKKQTEKKRLVLRCLILALHAPNRQKKLKYFLKYSLVIFIERSFIS